MLGEAELAPEGLEHPLQLLAKSHSRKTHSRHAQARRYACHGSPRAKHASLGALSVVAGGACGLRPRALDRHGGLELGAARLVPGRLARHGQRQFSRLFGSNVCRRRRLGSRLLRGVRGDDALGATDRSRRQLSHHATFACQSHPHGHVLGSQSQSRSPRRCQWDRNARRSISIGPGQQRNSLSTWSWRGSSGCAQQKQRGAGSTTSSEPSEGLSWGGAKEGSSSTFPSVRPRRCSKQAAAWRASRRLVDLGPWDPGWEFPSQEALTHTLRNAVTCGDWAVQVTRVMLFIKCQTQQAVTARCSRQWAKEACQGSRQAPGTPSPRLASATASMAGWLGRSCLSHKLSHGCCYGWVDWGEVLPRPSLEEVDDVCKTSKSTAGLGHDCISPLAVVCCPVYARRWRKSGERARRGPLLGLPGQGVRPCCLGAFGHGGGSKVAAAVGGFVVTGPGQNLRTCLPRSSLGRGSANKLPKASLGLLVRFRQVCYFSFLGLWDHSSRLQWRHQSCQTHAGNSPGNSGNMSPDQQALERG